MKKILITGGTGFIGAYLARYMVEKGHQVTVVDNNLRGSEVRLKSVKDDVNFIKLDLVSEKDKLVEISKSIDCIFHLAALNGTENFYNHPDIVLDVGVYGILHILRAVEENEISQLIVASSAEVYQTAKVVPTDEKTALIVPNPTEARYSYGASKIISEQLTLAYLKANRISNACIFRPHNIYGPDMGSKHVIPQFINRAIKIQSNNFNEDFKIQGDGTETRAFCYVNDLIDGLDILMNKGNSGEIYHLGNTEEVSINELFKLLNQSFNNSLKLSHGALTSGSTERRCPDIGKVMKLGYLPKFSLEKGLKETIAWYSSNDFTSSNPLI